MKSLLKKFYIVFSLIIISVFVLTVIPHGVSASEEKLTLVSMPSTVQVGNDFNIIVKFSAGDIGADGLIDGMNCDVTTVVGANLTGGSMLNVSTGKSYTTSLSDEYDRENITSNIQIRTEETVQATLQFNTTGSPLNVGSIQCYNQGFGTTSVTPGSILVAAAKPAIATKTLPGAFTKEKSKTTNISTLTKEDVGSFKGFVLDIVGKAKVEFTRSINLGDSELLSVIEELDKYVLLKTGSVEIKASEVGVFNTAATITMYGLNLNPDAIEILKDGELADVEITDVEYNPETQILTFKVSGFSKYQVGPGLEINEEISTSLQEYTLIGKVSDYDAVITAEVNGEAYDEEITIDENGLFEIVINNQEGENTVIVTAASVSGVEEEITVTITYGEAVNAGTISETAPEKSSNTILIVGGAFILIVLIVGGYLLYKRRSKKKTPIENEEDSPTQSLAEDDQSEDIKDSLDNAPSLAQAMQADEANDDKISKEDINPSGDKPTDGTQSTVESEDDATLPDDLKQAMKIGSDLQAEVQSKEVEPSADEKPKVEEPIVKEPIQTVINDSAEGEENTESSDPDKPNDDNPDSMSSEEEAEEPMQPLYSAEQSGVSEEKDSINKTEDDSEETTENNEEKESSQSIENLDQSGQAPQAIAAENTGGDEDDEQESEENTSDDFVGVADLGKDSQVSEKTKVEKDTIDELTDKTE